MQDPIIPKAKRKCNITKNIYNIILLLSLISAYSLPLGGTPIYSLVVIILLLYEINIIIRNKTHISHIWLLFIITAFLSICINFNEIESFFKPIQRFCILLSVLIVASPLLWNKRLLLLRDKIFLYSIYAFICISFLSFIGYFVGYGVWKNGQLTGFTDFPNSLGLLSSISAIYILSYSNKFKGIKIIIPISLIIILIWVIISSGTRTSLITIAISFLLYLYLRSKSLIKIILISILTLASGIAISKYINFNTEFIEGKMQDQEENGNSRKGLFEARILEFNDSPIWGIGTFRVNKKYWPVNTKTGTVEGGNSFLIILSMMGLIGFTLFVIGYLRIVIPFLRNTLKKAGKNLTSYEIFLFLLTISNFIVMQQTAITLNAGSYQTFYTWLSISVIYSYNKKISYETRIH